MTRGNNNEQSKRMGDDQPAIAITFQFFTETGIINQLSGAMLQSVLPDGVHQSHFAIVNHLTVRGDGKEPARIAQAMQVTKATMTHSLKVLQNHGFIETRPNPDDARGKHVFLTERGREFRIAAMQNASARFEKVITAEMKADMEACLPALQRIRKHLDDNR